VKRHSKFASGGVGGSIPVGRSTSVLGIGGVSGMIAFETTSNRMTTFPIASPGAGSGVATPTFCAAASRK